MGRDKARLPFAGSCLVSRALDILRELPLASPPRIAGAHSDLSAFAPVIADLHAACGPLSGIEAGLTATSQPLNVFLAIDLPFIPSGFLRWLLARATLTGAMVTCTSVLGRLQPLCAIYHRDLLPKVTASLGAGSYKVACLLDRELEQHSHSMDHLDMELAAAADSRIHTFSRLPWREWFRNLNSPQDLAASAQRAERAGQRRRMRSPNLT